MENLRRFSAMTVLQRESVFSTLGEAMCMASAMAKSHGDPIWNDLEETGRRLSDNTYALARDKTERAEAVLLKAIDMLGRYEIGYSNRTRH